MSKIYSYFYLKEENTFLHCFAPSRAYLHYKEFRINLLTGKKEDYSIDRYFERLEHLTIEQYFQQPIVMHLFYELGYKFIGRADLISSETPLMLSIEYQGHHFVPQSFFERDTKKMQLKAKQYPLRPVYQKSFNKIYDHLLKGDCYQVNLTDQFCFDFPDSSHPMHFLFKLWSKKKSISPYAHCTYIDSLHKLFVSNSPECLFQIRHEPSHARLYSMPIKGTMIDSQENVYNLNHSQKNQAELYMIADLVRNDLSRIHRPNAKIIKKKEMLKVPGLIHQYSILGVDIPYETPILKIISNLFPGGSITGAPKKRVMEIIKGIELEKRGFYCGSTIIFHKSLKAASINIRSSEIDFEHRELLYGAGGGITLGSDANQEFDELYSKMKSFVDIIQ
jgi:para-aminobenzoate synthetase component 1